MTGHKFKFNGKQAEFVICRLLDLIGKVEWTDNCCPWCNGRRSTGHYGNCSMSRMIQLVVSRVTSEALIDQVLDVIKDEWLTDKHLVMRQLSQI